MTTDFVMPENVARPTIYTEVSGTNCTLPDGRRGVVTAFLYLMQRTKGAFVRLNEGGMVYVALGQKVGDRGSWHEIESARDIDREEFDRLTQIDVIRTELGWRE